jgi:hypothetical protein
MSKNKKKTFPKYRNKDKVYHVREGIRKGPFEVVSSKFGTWSKFIDGEKKIFRDTYAYLLSGFENNYILEDELFLFQDVYDKDFKTMLKELQGDV